MVLWSPPHPMHLLWNLQTQKKEPVTASLFSSLNQTSRARQTAHQPSQLPRKTWSTMEVPPKLSKEKTV